MAEENDIVLKIAADTEQVKKDLAALSSKIKSDPPGKDAGDAFGSSFALNLIAVNQGLQLASTIASGIGSAFQKGLELAVKGEEINAIGARFEAIADQAGLVPDSLSKGIALAINGTVDMEDALQSASGAIIALGTNAERIPEIFDLAKKSTQLFGGDTTERFKEISSAIASGNTRMLRQIGIIVDSDKAIQKYANEIGVAKENLSQAQKQQAIMNEVLSTGADKFRSINGSITPISENLKKQKVAWGELGDTVALVFNKAFGQLINERIQETATYLDILNIKLKQTFLGEMPNASDKVKVLKDDLYDLNAEMAMLSRPGMFNQEAQIAAVQSKIEKTKEQLLIEQQLANQEATSQALKQNSINTHNAEGQEIAKTNEERKAELELLRSSQEEYEKIADRAATFGNFASGFNESLTQMAGTVKKLGSQVGSTFVTGFTNAFASVGKALATGGNALDEFGKQALSTIGAIAIQMGQFLILAGFGFSALPGFFSAGGAIAAGLGLIILGGFLQGLGGGSSGSNATAMNGGGIGETAGTSADLTKPEERNTPQTGVQVVVNGNIFDNKESALQIAQLLNDSFDLSGTLVRANA